MLLIRLRMAKHLFSASLTLGKFLAHLPQEGSRHRNYRGRAYFGDGRMRIETSLCHGIETLVVFHAAASLLSRNKQTIPC